MCRQQGPIYTLSVIETSTHQISWLMSSGSVVIPSLPLSWKHLPCIVHSKWRNPFGGKCYKGPPPLTYTCDHRALSLCFIFSIAIAGNRYAPNALKRIAPKMLLHTSCRVARTDNSLCQTMLFILPLHCCLWESWPSLLCVSSSLCSETKALWWY